MKMVKSLFLGTAAGVVAVTVGQAAKPVEYVKVCNPYGAGFYYMPGTDMCIKIGGWVRAEWVEGGNGNLTWGPYAGNVNNLGTSNSAFRARGYITADAREQTSYGVARAYIAVGINTNYAGLQSTVLVDSVNRAFVQWAGFTAGLTESFYDFYSVPAVQYRGGYLPASDTGDPGWFTWGYTAELGNGLSATVATEDRRTTQIIAQVTAFQPNSSIGTFDAGSFINATTGNSTGTSVFPANGAYGGQQVGDIVANIRVDETWGGAQVMGALHELNTTYYPNSSTSASVPFNGEPGTKWGFAVGGGLKLNFPNIAEGDYFQSQVNYTQGALRYLFFTPNSNWGKVSGASESWGVLSDCVYGENGAPAAGALPANPTGCQLTTAWGFNASYEHYWTPEWHESFYGAYYAVLYNTQANAMLCVMEGNGVGGAAAPGGSLAVAGLGCNNNWSVWGVGSRLQWDVTKSFYLGVEVLYENMKSATLNTTGILTGSGVSFGAANTQANNENNWMVSGRLHKDFLP